MLKVPVIVPDFPLDFAVFFPSGKIRYMKGKSGTSRGKSSETTGGFPWQTAPKLHSSLVLCTFYRGTRTSPRPPPPPLPGSARLRIPSRPVPHPGQTLPAHSGPGVRRQLPNFSRAQYRSFLGTYRIFSSREGTREYFCTNGENSLTALKLSCPPRRAAQYVVPRHFVELQPLTCTKCCISHSNSLKSQR